MPLGVEADHLQLERLLVLHHVAGMEHSIMRKLADVNEALKAVSNAYERAEVDELGDRPLNEIADLDIRDRCVPRIWLQLSNGEADASTLRIDVDHFGINRIAHLVVSFRVRNL